MKKVLAGVCCTVLALSIAAGSLTAYAAQTEIERSRDPQRGAFTCSYSDDGATITGFDQNYYAKKNPEYNVDHKLSIPYEIKNEDDTGFVPVKAVSFDKWHGIGWKDGKDACTFTTLEIPATVTYIDDTFSGLTNLEYVTFEEGTKLDYDSLSFNNCTNLKRIGVNNTDRMPELGVTYYSRFYEESFANCTSLNSIVLPTGITTIERRAFEGCTSLKSVNIPSTVINVYYEAFMNCENLTSVKFDLDDSGKCSLESLSYLSNYYINNKGAFDGCKKLELIELPVSSAMYGYSIGEGCFKNSGLTGINIPKTVKSIDDQAFACTKLEENALKTPKGESYGIAFFDKSTEISENAFTELDYSGRSIGEYVSEIKPIIAGYEDTGAEVYAVGHDCPPFVSLGTWDPYKTKGDINGDGEPATPNDLIALIKYINGLSTNVNEEELDVNEDGEPGTPQDLIRLIKIMNGLV